MFTEKTAIVRFPDYLDGKISGLTNLHGWWKPPEYVLSFWANGCIVPYNNDEDYTDKRVEIFTSLIDSTIKFIKTYNHTLRLLSVGDVTKLATQRAMIYTMDQENIQNNARRMLLDLINDENLSQRKFLKVHFMTHDKTTLECAT